MRKNEILRGFQAFSRVIGEGRTFAQSPVRLFVRTDPTLGPMLRVGFSVSRSIRSAVRRNRCRRLMREAFRLHRSEHTLSGCEIVFMFTGSPERATHLREVESAVRSLMRKASA